MTLLDNVLLGTYARTTAGFIAGPLGLKRGEEAQARHEALRQLARVGLADRPYELAGNLPLGSQRLVEIARALAADPVLLVLDETRRRAAPAGEAGAGRTAAGAAGGAAHRAAGRARYGFPNEPGGPRLWSCSSAPS